jgi:small ligand-binding sensory domain FIST
MPMRFAAAVSEETTAGAIAADLVRTLPRGPEGEPTDLAVLFYTPPLIEQIPRVLVELGEALSPGVTLGVSAEGIVGGSREIERRPAISLLVGRLPDAVLKPFYIGPDEWRDLLDDDERLQQRVGTGEKHRAQLILADPFSTPIDALLTKFDETLKTPTLGGMASGGMAPGTNLLVLDQQMYSGGAVGVGIGGEVKIDAVVSQGCRPVGEPLVITRVEGNMVLELGRRPALAAAQEMLRSLAPEDQQLLQGGLFVGVAIDEYRDRFERGDFLIRGLLGADPQTGALALGDFVRAGQTVQFHVRDVETAHEDLLELLAPQRGEDPPAGALLFSCNGRGSRMFSTPNHDALAIQEALPGLPLAGFFAMGELGPIGGRSFIHGHTASLCLFRPA